MNKRLMPFLILLLSLALLYGCGGGADADTDAGDQVIPPPQDHGTNEEVTVGLTSFRTTDIYGEEKTQEIFSGYDMTLVNVWGTFCKPCLDEMPFLGELHKEYEPQGVNIVGIVVDVQDNDLQIIEDQRKLAQDIAAGTGADYTHLLVSEELIQSVLSQFDAIPASFFVDSDGNIISEFYIGSREKEDWKALIDENLAVLKKE